MPSACCMLLVALSAMPQLQRDSVVKPTADSGAHPAGLATADSSSIVRRQTWKPLISRVRRTDGASVAFASVALRAPGNTEWRSTVADSAGRFRFDSVSFGSYDLRVVLPERATAVSRRVVIDANEDGDLIVPTAAEPSAYVVVLVLAMYLLSIVVTRWHHIARSVDEMLQRQLDALETRLLTEVSADGPKLEALRARVRELRQEATLGSPRYSLPGEWRTGGAMPVPTPPKTWWGRLTEWFSPGPPFKRRRFWEFWFWSRGRENAAWAAIHEVERQLASFLSPDEYVDVYLRWAAAQLRTIERPDAGALAATIATSLDLTPTDSNEARASIARGRRALLGRALAVIYNDRDTSFSTLMEWQNKASWLMLAAAIFIGSLSLSAGGAVLFLSGAAGGFSSRLMRALRREDVPLDYGASWTTLYLSPLFGALAGWFGIAIVTFATSPEINLLGAAFRRVDWYDPTNPVTLAIAFMMGFSERLFDAVTRAVEMHAESAQSDGRQAAPPVIRPPVAPANQPPGVPAGVGQNGAALGSLQLPTTPTALGTPIAGSFTLTSTAIDAVEVNLLTDAPQYEIRPAILTIPAGQTAGSFHVVALEGAASGTITITAHFLETSVSSTAEVFKP